MTKVNLAHEKKTSSTQMEKALPAQKEARIDAAHCLDKKKLPAARISIHVGRLIIWMSTKLSKTFFF